MAILTTHAGSLPRPAELDHLYAVASRGEPVDADRLAEVRRQLEGLWGDRLGRLASGIAGEAER